jgi:flavin-dependent dehydrogenase
MVIVIPDLVELSGFRADLEGRFMEHALSCAPVARALGPARRTGNFLGMVRWGGFFRRASGPGWVLVGDAGHFKDPCAGRGIGDAFHQVDALAPAITAGLAGSDTDLDQAMVDWGHWRDRDFAAHHWFAQDLGKAGQLPAAFPEIIRGLHAHGKAGEFLNLFAHRSRPSQVLTPPRLFGATGHLLLERGAKRGALLREARTLVAEDTQRRRLNRRPVYAAASHTREDAGPTEIEESAV